MLERYIVSTEQLADLQCWLAPLVADRTSQVLQHGGVVPALQVRPNLAAQQSLLLDETAACKVHASLTCMSEVLSTVTQRCRSVSAEASTMHAGLLELNCINFLLHCTDSMAAFSWPKLSKAVNQTCHDGSLDVQIGSNLLAAAAHVCIQRPCHGKSG